MRRVFFALFFLIISFPLFAASPAELIGVRIQSKLKASHFVFMLNKRVVNKLHYEQAKQKLILEFVNTHEAFKIDNMKLMHTNVSSLSTQVLPHNRLRFIFNLQGPIQYKSYFLKRENGSGEKLQLDILSLPVTEKKNKQAVFLPKQLKNAFKKEILKTFAILHGENKPTLLAQNTSAAAPSFYVSSNTDHSKRMFNIVIDAGHGGKDSGARGTCGALEKNIVLRIARKLAQEINLSKHMRAFLTRSKDTYVPLRERLQLARQRKADLFIAIHADAFFNKTATGASVYALSARGATTEAARWLAKQENYSELGGVELDALQDRSPLLRSVLIDLAQTATIRDSLVLGNKVLDALDSICTLHYKHVAQAPFVVLKSPDIPSILVETGFISNPREEKRLANAAYQQQIARALYRGIAQYVQKNAIFGQ